MKKTVIEDYVPPLFLLEFHIFHSEQVTPSYPRESNLLEVLNKGSEYTCSIHRFQMRNVLLSSATVLLANMRQTISTP